MNNDSDDVDHLLTTLASAKVVEIITPSVHSAHRPFHVTFEGGSMAIAKASNAPIPQAVRMVRHEVAAFEVARMIGATWLVPPTVLRVLPAPPAHDLVVCSVQLFIPSAEDRGDLAYLSNEDIALAAAFDTAVLQLDRARHNWMVAWSGKASQTCVRPSITAPTASPRLIPPKALGGRSSPVDPTK